MAANIVLNFYSTNKKPLITDKFYLIKKTIQPFVSIL
jgi:hypothetical protein